MTTRVFPLFTPTARRLVWLLLAVGLLVLATHRSQEPRWLGRFSTVYALLLLGYASIALGLGTWYARASHTPSASVPEVHVPGGAAWWVGVLASLVLWWPRLWADAWVPGWFAEASVNPVLRRLTALLLGLALLLVVALASAGALWVRVLRQRSGLALDDAHACAAIALISGLLAWLLPGLHAPTPLRAASVSLLASLAPFGLHALAPAALRPLIGPLALALGSVAWMAATVVPTLIAAPEQAERAALGVVALGLVTWSCLGSRPAARRAMRLVALALVPVPVLLTGPARVTTASPARPAARTQAWRPNILIVMLDTLRADHGSPWGFPRPTTPVLEQALADARNPGTLFMHAWSGAASTIPSVKALFTGQAPSRWGFDAAATTAAPVGVPTLAGALRRAGYATAGFSANHLVSGPGFEQGFEHWRVLHSVERLQSSFFFGQLLAGDDGLTPLRWATDLGLHKVPGEAVWETAGRWLAEPRGARPFFAYVHLMEPHWPYREYGYPLHEPAERDARLHLSYVDLLRLPRGDPRNARLRGSAELRELTGRYVQEVRHADTLLGRILADLRARGQRDDTLVIVLADHGEEFFEHNSFGHGFDVYPEQVHVPLAFLWPAAGRPSALTARVDTPVSLLDVFPTLMDYLQLPMPRAADGRSLRALLEGRADAGQPVLAEAYGPTTSVGAYREGPQAVRLVFDAAEGPAQTARVLLFDASTGQAGPAPFSAEAAASNALVARARAAFQARWEQAAGAPQPSLAPDDDDAEAAERLRALGYVR
jgi:arylsulfatase A-like enzyme